MTMRHFLSASLSAALAAALPLPAAAQTAPVQDYDPAPAMWVLQDEDTTIYMLGTIHMLPDGFRWRNPQLDGILGEVDELVLESSDAEADASMASLGGKFARLLESRTPTSQQLSPAARGKWRRLVEMSGQPFDYVDQMPLMVALMGFGMMGMEDGPSDYANGVETVLEAEFMESGRPISSIEDAGRVMMSLYRIDDNLVLRNLERDLISWDGNSSDVFFAEEEQPVEMDWELEQAWARGEVQDGIDFGIAEPKLAQAFHRVLITNRNRRWAAWLDDRLDRPGTILLAVGAGHFEGEDSVLAMLRERNLEARRINQPVR